VNNEDDEFQRIEREQKRFAVVSDIPTFSTWDRATLDQFALDACVRMKQQQETIEQLTLDKKTIFEAYRMLIKGTLYDC
jgi:hypothetical protein